MGLDQSTLETILPLSDSQEKLKKAETSSSKDQGTDEIRG